MSRLLLVEDHTAFREALALLLNDEPTLEVVAQCGSLAQCRSLLLEGLSDIDVALLDLALPDGEGTELIEVVRGANPRVKVLILSGYLDEGDLSDRMAALGVDRVLDKTIYPPELVAEVVRLVSG